MATADNLKLTQQLLATMQQITLQLEKQAEVYSKQAGFVEAICKAQDCFNNLDSSKLKEVTENLQEAQEKTKGFGREAVVTEEQINKMSSATQKVAVAVRTLAVPLEFINGFKSGIKLSNNLLRNILSFAGPIKDLAAGIAMSLLSLPGRLMDFFQKEAGSGVDPYREALEKLREEFGNLKIGTSQSVRRMTEDMKGLGEAGLRMSRVFGYGREGLAKLLTENMELAKGMGPIFNRFAAGIRGAESEMTVLRKSTGLGAEAFKSIQLTAENSGQRTGTAIRNMVKDMARAERAFGISVKEMGKDLDFMMKETASFGILAPQQMLKVSVYARKLGISMEALKGIMEKTLNFEDAASQSAKLSEAFNIQIDAMKLMSETDPTKKMDMYRQAFFKTGQNIESMSVAQRKYLADTTGMTEETLRIAFAQKNRALSGAQLDAQMKKAQKTQISQAEAMKILAESITRLVQSGQALKGSFLDMFADGFMQGIRRTREFREVVIALQRSMRVVYMAGRQVGRMFVKEFPGVIEILKSLKEMFDPARFRSLMKKVVGEFQTFFRALRTDPRGGVETFMKNMKKNFFDFFNSGSPAGRRFVDGLKAYWNAIFVISVAAIKHGLTSLRDALKTITEFIKNPRAFLDTAQSTVEGISGSFAGMAGYLERELKPVFLEAAGALWGLIKLMADKLYQDYIKPNLGKILLAYFAPALVTDLVRGTGALMFKALGSYLFGAARSVNTVAASAAKAGGAAGSGAMSPGDIMKQATTTRQTGQSLMRLAGSMLILIAGVSLMAAAVIGLSLLYKKSGVSPQDVAVVTALFGVMTLLLVGMAAAMPILAGLGAAIEASGGTALAFIFGGLLTVGAVLAGVAVFAGVTIRGLIAAISPEKMGAATQATEILLTFVGIFGRMAAVIGLLAVSAPLAALGSFAGIFSRNANPLNVLQDMVSLIAAKAIDILGMLNNMPGDVSVLQAKARVFEVVAQGVSSLMTPLAQIVLAVSSSVFPNSAADSVVTSVGSLMQMVSLLTNPVDGVIPSLMRRLGRMAVGNVDSERMKTSAAVFTAVSSGLGSLMGGVGTLLSQFNVSVGDWIMGIDRYVIEQKSNALKLIAETVLPSLQKALSGMMTSVLNFTRGINNTEALKAVGPVLSAISETVSSVLTAVSGLLSSGSGSFMEGFDSLVNVISGGSSIDVLRDKMATVQNFIGQLASSIQSLLVGSEGRMGIIPSLRGLIDAAPTDAAKIRGLSVVSELIKTVTSVIAPTIEAVSNLTRNVRAGNGANVAQIRMVGIQLGFIIQSISTTMSRLVTALPAMVEAIGRINIPPSLATKVKAVKSVLDLVTQLGSVVSSFRVPSGGGNSRQLNVWSEVFVPTLSLLSYFALDQALPDIPGSGGHRRSFEAVLRGISTLNFPRGFSSKIQLLKQTFESIKVLAEATKSIRELAGTGITAIAANFLTVPLQNLGNIISELGRSALLTNANLFEGIPQISRILRGKGSMLTAISSGLSDLFSSVSSISGLTLAVPEGSVARLNTQMTTLFGPDGVIGQLGEFFSDDSKSFVRNRASIRQIKNNLVSGITANVRAMVESYNTFSRDLATLGQGTQPLQVTLNALGDRLGGVQTATIRNAAVNATINVEVKMSAADIVMAMKTQTERTNATSPTPARLAAAAFNPVATIRNNG